MIPLTVLPDESDDVALQACVDMSADGVQLRMLMDTGTARTAVPHVEPFTSRTTRPGPGGRGAFGATATDPLIELNTLQNGDLVTNRLVVERQPEGWVHPPLLGINVLGSHACLFDFTDQTLHLDTEAAGNRRVVSADHGAAPHAHGRGELGCCDANLPLSRGW